MNPVADFVLPGCGYVVENMQTQKRSTDALQVTGPFDDELLSILPSSMKYICHNGAGYDNIDIAACSKRGSFRNEFSVRAFADGCLLAQESLFRAPL
jgi:phosphoglycerate dehydrogenase-like enzyme